MAIILNIDTAVEIASMCLAREMKSLQYVLNNRQQEHAAWLHPAIRKMLSDEGMTLKDLDAITVSIGPGSYTGLRVGLAAAKGLCFALQIPLIPLNTLEMIAYATRKEEGDLLCPLIDAKRMEVFTAIYNKELGKIIEPTAMIIALTSFESLLQMNRILFSGNGSEKVKRIVTHPNALFTDTKATAADMVELSQKYYNEKRFADVAYIEPLYLKEFYSAAR